MIPEWAEQKDFQTYIPTEWTKDEEQDDFPKNPWEDGDLELLAATDVAGYITENRFLRIR